MHVELVSPEGILFEGDAQMVVARTVGEGDIAFMTGHVPFIGSLTVHPVKILMTDGSSTLIAAHRGFIEMQGDKVSILSDVAEVSTNIDVARATAARAKAEEALRADPANVDAQGALRRAEVRLGVAAGEGVSAHH